MVHLGADTLLRLHLRRKMAKGPVRDVLVVDESVVKKRRRFIELLGDDEGFVHTLACGQAAGRISRADDFVRYRDDHDAFFATFLGNRTLDRFLILSHQLQIRIESHFNLA